jgi:hypothetical protein
MDAKVVTLTFLTIRAHPRHTPPLPPSRNALTAYPLPRNERKAVGQVVTRTAVELHPLANLASDNAETVVLDLMQPISA